LIDLHSHTTESDGSLTPLELIGEAVRAGVRVLSITDHDTFAGFDVARDPAALAGIELLCGIELSTRLDGQSVHLLDYFPGASAPDEFKNWVLEMQASRRDRNVRLAARLRELGFDITVEEAEARGRGMTGRPHFARIMVEKGYVSGYRQAFDEYLDESACAYVYRREPSLPEGIARIREAGGTASLAHPTRIHANLEQRLPDLCAAGLDAIEAYHSDHTPEETAFLLALAARYGLVPTGGSDFHGIYKPEVQLGTGCGGNLNVPPEVVERLKRANAVRQR
jgi:predicted metal-dependent phosphoesterase TrpH